MRGEGREGNTNEKQDGTKSDYEQMVEDFKREQQEKQNESQEQGESGELSQEEAQKMGAEALKISEESSPTEQTAEQPLNPANKVIGEADFGGVSPSLEMMRKREAREEIDKLIQEKLDRARKNGESPEEIAKLEDELNSLSASTDAEGWKSKRTLMRHRDIYEQLRIIAEEPKTDIEKQQEEKQKEIEDYIQRRLKVNSESMDQARLAQLEERLRSLSKSTEGWTNREKILYAPLLTLTKQLEGTNQQIQQAENQLEQEEVSAEENTPEAEQEQSNQETTQEQSAQNEAEPFTVEEQELSEKEHLRKEIDKLIEQIIQRKSEDLTPSAQEEFAQNMRELASSTQAAGWNNRINRLRYRDIYEKLQQIEAKPEEELSDAEKEKQQIEKEINDYIQMRVEQNTKDSTLEERAQYEQNLRDLAASTTAAGWSSPRNKMRHATLFKLLQQREALATAE